MIMNLKTVSNLEFRDCKEGVDSFFEKRKPMFIATLDKDGPPSYPWWDEINTKVEGKSTKSRL
jgi:hypothetical protein